MALNPLNSGNLEQLALKRLTASLNYLMKLKIEPFSATAIQSTFENERHLCPFHQTFVSQKPRCEPS